MRLVFKIQTISVNHFWFLCSFVIKLEAQQYNFKTILVESGLPYVQILPCFKIVKDIYGAAVMAEQVSLMEIHFKLFSKNGNKSM